MSDEVNTYRLAALEKKVSDMEAAFKQEIKDIEDEVKAEVKARQDDEKRKLKWGISMLGTLLLSVVGVVWTYRSVIFK